jgi:hypothetical protein
MYEYMERLAMNFHGRRRPDRKSATKGVPKRRGSTEVLKEKVRSLLSKERFGRSTSRSSSKLKLNIEGEFVDPKGLDLRVIDLNERSTSRTKKVSKRRKSTGASRDKVKTKSWSSSKLKVDSKESSGIDNLNLGTVSPSRGRQESPKERSSTGGLKVKVTYKDRSKTGNDNSKIDQIERTTNSTKSSPKKERRKRSAHKSSMKVKDRKGKSRTFSAEIDTLKQKKAKSTHGKDSKKEKSKDKSTSIKKTRNQRKGASPDHELKQVDCKKLMLEDTGSLSNGKITSSMNDRLWDSMSAISDYVTQANSTEASIAAKRHRHRAEKKKSERSTSIHSLLTDD